MLEDGEEVPAEFDAIYDVWDIARPYWEGFHALAASRRYAVGMGVFVALGVPYSEVACWAKDHGLADTPADLDETVRIIGALDEVASRHLNRGSD